MSKKIYKESIFLIILGIVTSLSLPPFNYLLINFFSFTLIFIFLIKKSEKHKNIKIFFLYGWLFGFGYFISSLYWISISLSYDPSFQFLIPVTVILIPAFLGLFYGLITFLFIIFKTKKIINSFLIFSLIFSLIEFLRGSIFTGFPWNLIAYSFSNHLKILSLTSIIGTYGFNLLCISLFVSPALLILRNTKKEIYLFFSFFLVFILSYVYGSINESTFNNLQKKTLDYNFRIIGSNITLDRFYSDKDPILIIKDLIDISDPDKNKKLIFVWPEGILPGTSQEQLSNYNSLFRKNFSKDHLLIIGINNVSIINNSRNYFNSLSIYDNELNLLSFYNKNKLVPFGEFLPLEKIFKNIGIKSLTNNYQSFTSGNNRDIIEIKKETFSIKILPLICYEIIYSGTLFQSSKFDLIVNISEDGWFGKSIGPKQHFVHSIFRSIESGKYTIRSANNGIAGIINPLGEIEKKVDFGETGFIDFNEIKKMEATIFSKYGNKIFILLILLYIFLICSFNIFKNE